MLSPVSSHTGAIEFLPVMLHTRWAAPSAARGDQDIFEYGRLVAEPSQSRQLSPVSPASLDGQVENQIAASISQCITVNSNDAWLSVRLRPREQLRSSEPFICRLRSAALRSSGGSIILARGSGQCIECSIMLLYATA